MPITSESFRNFYLGQGAELLIASEFYLHGYEASKLSPDVGADYLVTNKAWQKFAGEDPVQFYLQVKSAPVVNGEARFYLDEAELDFLLSDETICCVFVCFTPVYRGDPKSLRSDYSDTSWLSGLEASYLSDSYQSGKMRLGDMGNRFNRLQCQYFWLNNKQLRRAVDEKYFVQNAFGKFVLPVAVQEEDPLLDDDLMEAIRAAGANKHLKKHVSLQLSSPLAKDTLSFLCAEIRDIYYLLNDCYCKDQLDSGDFLLEHYR